MWIKTHEINQVFWGKDEIPFGVTKNKSGDWEYGELPKQIGEQAFRQLQENHKSKQLQSVARDNALERYRRSSKRQASQSEKDHDQADED